MADRNATNSKAIWLKQAEAAKLKSEAEKAAAAKAAFEATFKDLSNKARQKQASDSESDKDDDSSDEDLSNKPIGPVDPSKCSAAGAGIAGGTAGAASSFMIVTKDSDGRKVPHGGAELRVKVAPGVGVGGSEQEGIVKDMNDGSYTVTYVVPKRGNYMLSIECNGRPIMGSPFPVFFSAGTSTGGLLGMAPPSSNFPNLVNQTMPNMPNYSASISGSFPGLLGMIPGVSSGPSGGAILPGVGASLGEVCREYLNGRCVKTDCKLNHPPHNLLMTALAATTSMGTLSQVPMAPSAAAMAAAQAIVAAQALQAHAAQVQAQQSAKDSSGSPDKTRKDDALKRTLQVSNLSPLLTVDQLKQLFSFCGTVIECNITDSKHFAYIEYSKPEEATAALALNNMDVGGRPLNVEMAKSLPQKSPLPNSLLASSSSLPMMMQQAVAMQQMQFQQALLMQQTVTAQQAANRAATMKTATELAAARAAEISKKLKADGLGGEETQPKDKSRSPSPAPARSRSKSRSPATRRRTSRARSRSKSRSPVSYHRRRRSRSYSPLSRYSRYRRSRSPLRSRNHRYDYERRSSKDYREGSDRSRRRDADRYHDHSPVSRRKRSRSVSPHSRKSYRSGSDSPKHLRESSPDRSKKSSRARSRSPRHHRERKTSPKNDELKLKYRKRSRSISVEKVNDKMDSLDGKEKHHAKRRSRSVSVEGKYPGRGRSPEGSSDENRLKDKSHSRSKSIVDKQNQKEKLDLHRDEKSKRSHRRRSRSKSVESNQKAQEKEDENEDRKSKRRYRRKSRSRSAEGKHSRSRSPRGLSESNKRKHKRRSRSRSLEGRHRLDARIDDRYEKSKQRLKEQSLSNQGSNGKSELSPTKSHSPEDDHCMTAGRVERRDDKSIGNASGEDIEGTLQEPDSAMNAVRIVKDDSLLTPDHNIYNKKNSVANISTDYNHGEPGKYEMQDMQH